jgi:hypothetical protein
MFAKTQISKTIKKDFLLNKKKFVGYKGID